MCPGSSLIHNSSVFDSESGYRAFQRFAGLKRAETWRKLGFANLVLAREAKARYRRERLARLQAENFSPFAIRDDLPKD